MQSKINMEKMLFGFQLERVFNRSNLHVESLVCLEALLYLRTTVDDGGMVSATNKLANT